MRGLLLAMLLVVLSVKALAEPMQVTVDTDYINLHSGPGRGYPILQVAIKGEQLVLLKKRNDWVQVSFKQQYLWLSRDDLPALLTEQQQHFALNDDRFDDFSGRSWEASLLFGDFNGSSYYQLSAAYLFSPHLQTELSVGQANGQQTDSQIAEISVLMNPFPQWRLAPYFAIGGGMIHTSTRTILVQTEDRNHALASAELGLRYYLTRQFIARAGYRHSVIVTDRNDNEEINTWKIGFSVFF